MSAVAGAAGAAAGGPPAAGGAGTAARYQRVAWVALGLASAVFVLLCAGGLYAGWRYSEHASTSYTARLVLAHGNQLEVRPAGQKTWQVASETTAVREGDSVRTGQDTDALIVLFDQSTIQLYYSSTVTLRTMRSSQFLNQEKDITVEQLGGSVKVATAARDPYAIAWFQVLSADGQIAVRVPDNSAVLVNVPDSAGGAVRLEVTTEGGSKSLVRAGTASWQEIGFRQMRRVAADNRISDALPAETELIVNGEFKPAPDQTVINDLVPGWKVSQANALGSLVKTSTENLRGQVVHTARFSRVLTSTTLASVGISQDLGNTPVNFYHSLTLQAQVKVAATPCVGGSLYPLTLRVVYADADGHQGSWERDFYAGAGSCLPGPSAIALDDDAWTPLPLPAPAGSWDLMAQSPPPVRLKWIEIVASGYSFNASVTDLALKAQ